MPYHSDKPIANPVLLLREEFDDWAVLFNPDTGHGFGLSPTGVHLWKLLDGEHTFDACLEETRHCAEGVPDEARKHIGAFIDELIAEGLAGFASTKFGLEFGLRNTADCATPHPEKCSHPPPGAVSGVKPLTYEPPKLVDLRGGGCAARGDCVGGSQDSGSCSPGGGAGINCWTGSSPQISASLGPQRRVANAAREIRPPGLLIAISETARHVARIAPLAAGCANSAMVPEAMGYAHPAVVVETQAFARMVPVPVPTSVGRLATLRPGGSAFAASPSADAKPRQRGSPAGDFMPV